MEPLTDEELEALKESLSKAFDNEQIDLIHVNSLYIESIKKRFKVSDLYFYKSKVFRYGHEWECSTSIKDMEHGKRTSAADTAKLLEDLSVQTNIVSRRRSPVHVLFRNTGKSYDNLDDLKHDYLTMKLSGL